MIEQAKEVAQRLRGDYEGDMNLFDEGADTIDSLVEEVETLRDSCAAKADRIDRLGETVERLTKVDVEPVAELGDGFMWCATCHSIQDSVHHTSPRDHDVWCKGEAQWVQGPFYLASALAALRSQLEIEKKQAVFEAINTLQHRHTGLIKAAVDLIAAVEAQHEKEVPAKFTIPYGAVNNLRNALEGKQT